jgi:thermostable 8-oxoguanine DNA glycosylase
MKQIKSKVYYDTKSGDILIITPEMQVDMEETTKEEDMKIYPQLKDKNIDDIDYIELDFGVLANSSSNITSYKMNLETKKLDITYSTQEEIVANNAAIKEVQNTQDRISAITSYVQASSDTQTITTFEDQIIELEKNKILNGDV